MDRIMGETIFEFTQMGNQMRVAAIDAKSGVEVIIITPTNIPQSQMQKIALAKLHRRMGQLGKK